MSFNKTTNKMTGTTGSAYTTVFANHVGAIGFRELGGESTRVRVEVFKSGLKFPPGWTTPDSKQKRFSLVVDSNDEAVSAVLTAKAIINAYKPPSLHQMIADALAA